LGGICKALTGQLGTQEPHKVQALLTLALPLTRLKAPKGHIDTHLPQPMQLGKILIIKLRSPSLKFQLLWQVFRGSAAELSAKVIEILKKENVI
jgi:hypothetical protein